MRSRSIILAVLGILCAWGVLLAQKPWREYPGEDRVPTPPDWNVPHEWSTARLMWRSYGFGGFGRGMGAWAIDYPGGDRNLIEGVRRLTRIEVRSVDEQADDFHGPQEWAIFAGRRGQLRPYPVT